MAIVKLKNDSEQEILEVLAKNCLSDNVDFTILFEEGNKFRRRLLSSLESRYNAVRNAAGESLITVFSPIGINASDAAKIVVSCLPDNYLKGQKASFNIVDCCPSPDRGNFDTFVRPFFEELEKAGVRFESVTTLGCEGFEASLVRGITSGVVLSGVLLYHGDNTKVDAFGFRQSQNVANSVRKNFAVTIDNTTINTAAFCDAFHATQFDNRKMQRPEFSIMLKNNLDAESFISLFHDFLGQYVDGGQVLMLEKKDSKFNYLEDLYEDVRSFDSGSLDELFSRVRENSNIEAACFKNLGYRVLLYCEPHDVTCKCQNGGLGSFDIFLKVSSEKPVFPTGIVSIRDKHQCLLDKQKRDRSMKFRRPTL